MSEQVNLPALSGGGGGGAKKRRTRSGLANVTSKARGDLLKYIAEHLKGRGPGQQLADLVTITDKERRQAKAWCRAGNPMAYKLLTPAEMAFRFKVWKFQELFGIDVYDATKLYMALQGDLLPYVHQRQAQVAAEVPDDRAQVAAVSDWIDGAGTKGQQNQQVDMFDGEWLTLDGSHTGDQGVVP